MTAFAPYYTYLRNQSVAHAILIRPLILTQWAVVAGHFAAGTTALICYSAYTTNIVFFARLLFGASVPAPCRNGVPVFDNDFHYHET